MATMVMRTRLSITLYVYCLYLLQWWNCKHTDWL